MSFFDAAKSLVNSQINKWRPGEDETREGALDIFEEFTLQMEDEDLIALKREWTNKWESYEPTIKAKQIDNENYWRGLHYGRSQDQYFGSDYGYDEVADGSKRPMVDNLIFEALETFLPIATKNNPEPSVLADNTEEGELLAKNVQKVLAYHADRTRLKLKMKRVCRYWALYLLGAVKVGWSEKENDISLSVLRPQKLILDPDGTIDDDMEYTGEFIGEHKKDTVKNLIERFPNKKEEILEEAQHKKGSTMAYVEWWTDDYVFWTMKDIVLGKAKNPHWNEQEEVVETDEFGNQETKIFQGRNHFAVKKKPYVFLSVFNLGKHPFDDTSLIGQNLANQDIVNKRQKQIDRNVDGMNGGWIVSGSSGLTKEEATKMIDAARRGGGMYVSSGNPNQMIARITGSGLPADVFNNMADTRNEIRGIFGVAGATAQGIANEQTVRGKIIIKEQDSSRIGGGVTEYLEQFADQIFNWWVQLMMVYYDETHVMGVIGQEKTAEFVEISKNDFTAKLTVSVKEGSLIPKDSLTQANQAVELTSAGLMDPITLYDKLDFPNPKDTAQRLFTWQQSPQLLFPEVAETVRQEQETQQLEQAATQAQAATGVEGQGQGMEQQIPVQ